MGTFPVSAAGVSYRLTFLTGRGGPGGHASYVLFQHFELFPSVKGSFGDVTASIQAVPKPPYGR